jgi:cell division protein FtsW (lipid II flippase)
LHGKPLVFGQFDAAPIEFLTVLGFALLAAVCSPLDSRRTIYISALVFIPAALYGACQVRFTFVAITLALFSVILIGEPKHRRYIYPIVAVFMLACVTGMAARRAVTADFLRYDATLTGTVGDCSDVDMNNSIAIRKKLIQESFAMMPRAGWFGLGLDSFEQRSCLKMPMHDSFAQAIVEFGWLGGALLIALTILVVMTLADCPVRL